MDFRKFSQSLKETETPLCFGLALGERENVQFLWWVNKKIVESVRAHGILLCCEPFGLKLEEVSCLKTL